MLWKPILILMLGFIASYPQTPQLKMPGDRQPDALPRELSETETQKILRENTPRPRVDATLKVSDTRLASALKFAEESQYKSAAQDVDVYTGADSLRRRIHAQIAHLTDQGSQCMFEEDRTGHLQAYSHG